MQLEKINIKGFHNIEDKTYLLNDINYFYGLNGAGKTTILNAIQLALLGYIPGTNKTKSDIFKHANSNIMSVTLDITGESDIVIKRSWMKTPKDIVASISITPDTLTEDDIFQLIGDLKLPVFDFNSFIDMTSNKLKDWFINFLPDVDVKIDWDKKLQDSLSSFKHILDEEFVRDTIQMHQGIEAESTIDKIQTYHKALKSLLSEKKAELTRIQSTIQELIFHDDLDEMTDIDSVKSEIAAIE